MSSCSEPDSVRTDIQSWSKLRWLDHAARDDTMAACKPKCATAPTNTAQFGGMGQ
jgi:hypothetical protein